MTLFTPIIPPTVPLTTHPAILPAFLPPEFVETPEYDAVITEFGPVPEIEFPLFRPYLDEVEAAVKREMDGWTLEASIERNPAPVEPANEEQPDRHEGELPIEEGSLERGIEQAERGDIRPIPEVTEGVELDDEDEQEATEDEG